MPIGYEQHFDKETGQWFYIDTKTDMVTYEIPLISTDGPAFVKASNVGGGGGGGGGGLIGRRREGAIGSRGASSSSSSSSGPSFISPDVNIKHSHAFAELPSGAGPTLSAEKPSVNPKVKVNPFQLEGFAKVSFLSLSLSFLN
jgi:hypothetical protein